MLSVELNDLEHFCGTTIGHSPWKTVTQEMIQAFADATGDPWRGQACLRGREPGDVHGLIGQTPEATQKKGPLGPFSHSDGC